MKRKPDLNKSISGIVGKLQSEGFRITQVRRHLIEFILSKKGHWTIQELGVEVRRRFPRIGIASIYRTVSLLAKLGALTETRFESNASRFEAAPQQGHHHDHLKCLDCDHIFEFENERIEDLQEKVAKDLGFRLAHHRMELYGECNRPRCPRRPVKER